ncbi:MAG: hypothetical protein ACTHW2_03370, partial [Tissierella sp.]|uniref:hypothetical protein n=1 Tax=Tissierella sp. TaxID=41274 RepID=UPI003F951A3D
MSNSRIRKHLKNIKIKSYIRDSWGILQEYGYNQNDVLNCSLGVNPYGSSDITKSQKKIDWDMVSAYPNPSYKRLKEAVTNYWSEISDLKNSEIFFGTGSMGILNILTKLFM